MDLVHEIFSDFLGRFGISKFSERYWDFSKDFFPLLEKCTRNFRSNTPLPPNSKPNSQDALPPHQAFLKIGEDATNFNFCEISNFNFLVTARANFTSALFKFPARSHKSSGN